jgi:hypothetical protein
LEAADMHSVHSKYGAVNHSKIVATEIIDDILKGAVKTDNNSTKRKHSVTDKTFVTWKEKRYCIL